MSTTLRLAQLNIEGSKHLDLIISFLKEQKVDVFCAQELFDIDIQRLETELQMTCDFVPMSKRATKVEGIGIFSKYPIQRYFSGRYGGSTDERLPMYGGDTIESKYNSQQFCLLLSDIEKDGHTLRVGTTHFPVTKHASVTDFQRIDMRALLALLEDKGEFVLCGDFNAPRGGEIFSMLSEKYIDRIPLEYTFSLDPMLHRSGPLPYMVDGYFSTPIVRVEKVTRFSGVSDHCAFIGDVILG